MNTPMPQQARGRRRGEPARGEPSGASERAARLRPAAPPACAAGPLRRGPCFFVGIRQTLLERFFRVETVIVHVSHLPTSSSEAPAPRSDGCARSRMALRSGPLSLPCDTPRNRTGTRRSCTSPAGPAPHPASRPAARALVRDVFGKGGLPRSVRAFQHVAAVVLGAYYEPCLLVLGVVESARAVDQLHEHALRRVLRVGRAAQKRVAQPIHRRGVAVEQCGYVDVVLQRFPFLTATRSSGGFCRMNLEDIVAEGDASLRKPAKPCAQPTRFLRAVHADLARF